MGRARATPSHAGKGRRKAGRPLPTAGFGPSRPARTGGRSVSTARPDMSTGQGTTQLRAARYYLRRSPSCSYCSG
eukprot:7198677-Alexandrium_andersonii.AAC.1